VFRSILYYNNDNKELKQKEEAMLKAISDGVMPKFTDEELVDELAKLEDASVGIVEE